MPARAPASGRRRPAQEHAIFAYRCVALRPFTAAGHDPAPIDDAFTSAAWGMAVAAGPVGRTRLAWVVVPLAAASSPPALSESSES